MFSEAWKCSTSALANLPMSMAAAATVMLRGNTHWLTGRGLHGNATYVHGPNRKAKTWHGCLASLVAAPGGSLLNGTNATHPYVNFNFKDLYVLYLGLEALNAEFSTLKL